MDKIAREKQSVNISQFNKKSVRKNNSKISQRSAEMEKNKTGKSRKMIIRQNGDRREDELTQQVTETTFS